MASPVGNETRRCEQCGRPLSWQAGAAGCLHCLLATGFEESEFLSTSPNDSQVRVYHHYEILTQPEGSLWELGRGAMGVTYKARDVNLNTPVALKVISAPFSLRTDSRRRFLREARAAACLRHPNVASVFHFGTINALPPLEGTLVTAEESADLGDCFYAMEFVEGETLEARIRRAGPLSARLSLEVAGQVTRALVAAEKRGLVHRDLKPSNIMLSNEPRGNDAASVIEPWVKVIDFGLAQAASDEDSSGPPRFFGTTAFASPEQLRGARLDIRSDIYSLGATLWLALTGKVPFPHRSRPGAELQPGDEPLPLEQLAARVVSAQVVSLLQSMLAATPAARPHSAAELARAIAEAAAALQPRKRARFTSSRLGRWVAGSLVGVAVLLLGLSLYQMRSQPNDKSIAVLPFRNLSPDPKNSFWADGVEDDLLSRLAKIHDLRVVSRAATARYPGYAPRDPQAIGRELGVRNLVEGSLRRAGDRVYVHVALIDTRDGHEIWSEGYDRRLADAVNLQGKLAGSIAEALDATLSPQESAGVRAMDSQDPDAYALYLRGRKFQNSPTFAISDYEAAQTLYTQAIALDPGFALAHARLAATLGVLYRSRGPSEELRRRAYAEAREALRLRPGLGEAHLASALCAYRIDRDFDRALAELRKAKKLLPNDNEAESFSAYIHRRRGEWREAHAALERSLKLDPKNATYEEELYTTAYLVRNWTAARRHATRAEALAPSLPLLKVQLALVDLWEQGTLDSLKAVFTSLPAYGDAEGTLAWMRWDAAMLARDYAAAQAAIDGFPFETLSSVYSAPVPKSYLEGCIALAQGEAGKAFVKFEIARPALEAETLAHPNNALRHARLGLLYAYMGRKAEAIAEGQRAVELQPSERDAFDGPENLATLALIYARVGEPSQAIGLIEKLLRQPGSVFFYEASMSQQELRLRWQWDPLRHDARFQQILAGPEPQTQF